MLEAFLGIDVGTGSARAGVFDATGRLLASAKQDIAIWRDAGHVVEQTSDRVPGRQSAEEEGVLRGRLDGPRSHGKIRESHLESGALR
jgi:glycerol kinase